MTKPGTVIEWTQTSGGRSLWFVLTPAVAVSLDGLRPRAPSDLIEKGATVRATGHTRATAEETFGVVPF